MPTILFYGVLHRDKTFENRSMSREEELLRDCLEEMIEAITRIETRFRGIESASDFTVTESGEIRMDAIAMMLVWLGESARRVGKLGGARNLDESAAANWKGARSGCATSLPTSTAEWTRARSISSAETESQAWPRPFGRSCGVWRTTLSPELPLRCLGCV